MTTKQETKLKEIPAGMKLRHTLRGHSNIILGMAWSPDGAMLASGSSDSTICIWDTENGKLHKTFKGHQDLVQSVSWSPDGQFLASGSADKTIRIWDVQKGKLFHVIEKHNDWVSSVSWSPKDCMIASCSGNQDPNIYIWKAPSNELLHILTGHKHSVNSVAWSSKGDILASSSNDRTIRLWKPKSGERIRVLKDHSGDINSVAWSPDGNILVSGSDDATIRTWDIESGGQGNIIEGHSGPVMEVLFSPDGEFLATQSYEQIVRLWRCDTWESAAMIREPTIVLGVKGGLAFHPFLPLIATRGENYKIISIWELDYDVLMDRRPADKSICYTNAKVVLMGETSTGKTCLARALMGKPFMPQEATHGMKIWVFESKKEKLPDGEEITREIFLWDLAGQTDYQVVHHLFLDGTAMGIVLFDPARSENLSDGVCHWEKALRKFAVDKCPRLLVAGRVDVGSPAFTDSDIQSFIKKHGFTDYIASSAKSGVGIKELQKIITQCIPWDNLPITRSPELWRKIREYLMDRRKEKNALTRKSDLLEAFRQKHPGDFTGVDFDAVICHAQAQGLVWRFSFGDFVLLEPEILNDYASAVVRAARKNPNGLGTVPVQQVYQAEIDLEDIQRLPDTETERVLLHAVVELFLKRQVALRESEQLVFPSKFNRQLPQSPPPPVPEVEYSFFGVIEGIYATLVVRLFYSGVFELKDLWKSSAQFRDSMGYICGFILECPNEGVGTLSVFFEDQVTLDSRLLFLRFIHEHLFRHTLTDSVRRDRIYHCPKCSEEVKDRLAVEVCLEKGKTAIICQYCEAKIPLVDLLEEKFGAPELLTKVKVLEKEAEEKNKEAVGKTTSRAKKDIGEFDVFLAHNSYDKEQVMQLSDRLKIRGLNPWLDIEQIPPGSWWQDVIMHSIQKVKSAAIIIGRKGMGKWQILELRSFINRCIKEGIPVIPVKLPGVTDFPLELLFLQELQGVEFMDNINESEPLDRLEWGITGTRPQRKQSCG